ncbi:MAG: MFS transporter [Caldilineaceae bacterium]|nr:MFS transporter [Caldilineaceae bacterium]
MSSNKFTSPARWRRWVPFISRAPDLARRQWQILALAGLAAFFATYSVALLQLALPQIQAGLAIPAEEVSYWGALIRLGALPAFLLTLAADSFGRRRLILVSLSTFSLLSGATAFAPTIESFAVLQFLVRTFVSVTSLLAGVMIIEEFPEHARGWGMGAYAALASIGGGAAALLFALVNVTPFGWRALFALSLVGLLFGGLFLRLLPETTRFLRQQGQGGAPPSLRRGLRPLAQLVRSYPGRFIAIAGVITLFNMGGDAALFYDPTYLQQEHGWQPWRISLLNLGAGFMAILGSAYAGRLSDQIGRKRTAMLFLGAFPLFIIGYYNVAGWLLPILWAGLLFAVIGAGVTISTLGGELFPTSYRSTALGAMGMVATVTGSLSLILHGLLFQWIGSSWTAVSLLALLILAAPLIVTRLPETSGRTLEEIAPER